jgi:hypothetical protein
MLGGGRYLGGHQKIINNLRGGGLPKISKKGRGASKIMYNNHKTSAIIVHCNIDVNAI